jgi:hypothetical protein
VPFAATAHAKTQGIPQLDYFDEALPDLALRVSSAGRKTWTFHYTSPKDGKRARLTIGTYPATTLASARGLATGPSAERAREGAMGTFAAVISFAPSVRQRSIVSAASLINSSPLRFAYSIANKLISR